MGALKAGLVHVSDPKLFGNPLALGYLKTYSDSVLGARVESAITELVIKDCLAAPAAAARRLLKAGPDLLAFSCYLWNIEAVSALCRALRRLGFRGKIVLGGPDASGRGAALLRSAGADAVVIGEGELTFADLLGRLLDGRPWAGTPGTVTLAGGRAVTGPRREYIKDLGVVPSPYLAGLFAGKKYRYYVYETSRGCPFRCAFCTWTSRSGLRYFPAARALEEARAIAAFAEPFTGFTGGGFRNTTVFVTDSEITQDAPRAARLFRAMRKYSSGRNLVWTTHAGLKHWTPALARAADSGHLEFGIGIESLDAGILASLGRRGASAAEARAALRNLREYAPKAKLHFQLMLGIPGDTAGGFMRSLRWALEACALVQPWAVTAFKPREFGKGDGGGNWGQLPRAAVMVFHTLVLPGSRLAKDAARLGVKWARQAPYPVLGFRGFTASDIDRCYEAMRVAANFSAAAFGSPSVLFEDLRRG